MTGKIPWPELSDQNVEILASKGKRPRRPRSFDATGITPGVWAVAERCWHEKPERRPEVKTVLQALENIASSGEWTAQGCSRLPRGLIALWISRPRTDTFHIKTDLARHSELNAISIWRPVAFLPDGCT